MPGTRDHPYPPSPEATTETWNASRGSRPLDRPSGTRNPLRQSADPRLGSAKNAEPSWATFVRHYGTRDYSAPLRNARFVFSSLDISYDSCIISLVIRTALRVDHPPFHRPPGPRNAFRPLFDNSTRCPAQSNPGSRLAAESPMPRWEPLSLTPLLCYSFKSLSKQRT